MCIRDRLSDLPNLKFASVYHMPVSSLKPFVGLDCHLALNIAGTGDQDFSILKDLLVDDLTIDDLQAKSQNIDAVADLVKQIEVHDIEVPSDSVLSRFGKLRIINVNPLIDDDTVNTLFKNLPEVSVYVDDQIHPTIPVDHHPPVKPSVDPEVDPSVDPGVDFDFDDFNFDDIDLSDLDLSDLDLSDMPDVSDDSDTPDVSGVSDTDDFSVDDFNFDDIDFSDLDLDDLDLGDFGVDDSDAAPADSAKTEAAPVSSENSDAKSDAESAADAAEADAAAPAIAE